MGVGAGTCCCNTTPDTCNILEPHSGSHQLQFSQYDFVSMTGSSTTFNSNWVVDAGHVECAGTTFGSAYARFYADGGECILRCTEPFTRKSRCKAHINENGIKLQHTGDALSLYFDPRDSGGAAVSDFSSAHSYGRLTYNASSADDHTLILYKVTAGVAAELRRKTRERTNWQPNGDFGAGLIIGFSLCRGYLLCTGPISRDRDDTSRYLTENQLSIKFSDFFSGSMFASGTWGIGGLPSGAGNHFDIIDQGVEAADTILDAVVVEGAICRPDTSCCTTMLFERPYTISASLSGYDKNPSAPHVQNCDCLSFASPQTKSATMVWDGGFVDPNLNFCSYSDAEVVADCDGACTSTLAQAELCTNTAGGSGTTVTFTLCDFASGVGKYSAFYEFGASNPADGTAGIGYWIPTDLISSGSVGTSKLLHRASEPTYVECYWMPDPDGDIWVTGISFEAATPGDT